MQTETPLGELVVLRPEPALPVEPSAERVCLEVETGDILQPGQRIGYLEQVAKPPSGNLLSIPETIAYRDLYEAEVTEVCSGEEIGEPLLRLRPIRQVAEYLLAEANGSWHCELEGYIGKYYSGEEILVRSGQQVGSIRQLVDGTRLPVIYSGSCTTRVLYVFTDKCGFVSLGDRLLIHQPQ